MDFADFAAITAPDEGYADAARARQDILTKPQGALGRLEELSVWVAACQGACPPRQFTRARVVVFAGDHGVATAGVSAYPPEVTAQMVANIDSGGAAINVLAGIGGATVRVVDIAVDCDEPLSEQIGAHKIRRSSGNIAVEDAMTGEQTIAAVEAGRRIADEEVDAGADLLIAGDMGIGNTTPTAALIAALTNQEPVGLVGRGTGVDDAGWARKTAAVRDALYRARGAHTPNAKPDPLALLRICGSADLAAMAGFCAQAALRRTPVLLDGVVVTAAALVADRLAPGARQWWQAGHRSTEPAHSIALADLGIEPIVDLRMRLGEGSGAAVALPILRAAVATLAAMATFGEAEVSDRADTDEPLHRTVVTTRYDYLRDGAEIYRRSFATIRAESDLSGVPAVAESTVVRMIHACGQTDLAADVRISAGCVSAARTALAAGAPILCDAHMVASGVTRKRLPADNEVLCFLRDDRVPELATQLGTTRTAAALELWRPLLAGSVVAIGNAPTALFALLEMIDAGAPRPAAIVGAPVGFIGAAESCAALHARDDLEYVTVLGRRGGSAITAAALNALASTAE